MKHIFKIMITASVALIGATGCNDDVFLKENPKTLYTLENAYNSADQVIATLATAYVSIQDSYYGVTDVGTSTDLYGAFYLFGGHSSHIGTWTTEQGKSKWDTYYKNIAYANQALYAAELPQIDWTSESEKNQTIAEAHFVRGLEYLRLAEYFGGVPIVKEYNTELKFDYERATRAEVYEFAISDLLIAYDNMVEHPKLGRPGKGAAGMILSEAYLGLGVADASKASTCFAKAAEYAKGVTELHPLMTKRFGLRADPTDKTSRLGVPTYLPNGTAFSDLFYGTNPRLAENTEAVWIIPGATSYNEYKQYLIGAESSFSPGTVRSMQSIYNAPVLRDVLLNGSAIKPWNTGGDVSEFYQGPNGSCSQPSIIPNGVPFVITPSWYGNVQQYDDEHNNGSHDTDSRIKEGVAMRSTFPITNPNHPDYGLEVYYGTDPQMKGWEDVDKSNISTAMEFWAVMDKFVPVDAWSNDEGDYYTATMGARYYRDDYIYRSAEAYLLLAEAYLRGGDASKAAEALNAVRSRSNCKPFDKSQITIQTILDERGRELMYEEDRWATFLRQEPEVWKERVYAYGQYTYRAGASLNPNAKLYPETQQFDTWQGTIKWDLWPIPLTYIDLNTDNPEGMQQNPGWNAE